MRKRLPQPGKPFFFEKGYRGRSAPKLTAAQAQPGGRQTGREKEQRFFHFRAS